MAQVPTWWPYGVVQVGRDQTLGFGGPAPAPPRRWPRPAKPRAEVTSGPVPVGHVRKKATGEIGRIRSVDARAGTATVHWLKQGRTSTGPLTVIACR